MIAAGIGQRLGDVSLPPKVLLRFGGETLLERHAAILRHCGVQRIDLIVGYRASEVEAEIDRIGARDLIFPHFNPDYEESAIVSLWRLREVFLAGEPVIFMDGDVLYDYRMMERLVASPNPNCFLMDRETEEGEDPVKMCLRDGILVDFHKRPQIAHDWWGDRPPGQQLGQQHLAAEPRGFLVEGHLVAAFGRHGGGLHAARPAAHDHDRFRGLGRDARAVGQLAPALGELDA